ncbi:hypothetical protein M422DRAFT_81178, partial [Sphaerobolus stellatus SS14]
TLSKRMRILASGIAGTASGSMLLSEQLYQSSHSLFKPILERPPPLPKADWSLLDTDSHTSGDLDKEAMESLRYAKVHIQVRDMMLERAYATMVLQDFYLRKINQALHKKEEKKGEKTDRRKILFSDGYGRHMTAEDFICVLEQDKRTRLEHNQQQARKQASRADTKAKKLKFENAWKDLRDNHKKCMDSWKVEVNTLKGLGKRGSDLPEKPPKLMLKANFAEQ